MRPPAHARGLSGALVLAACSQTATMTTADGGGTVDVGGVVDVGAGVDVGAPVDGPTGPCRQWRAGEAVVLASPVGPSASRTLLDLRAAEGGAWAVVSDDLGTNRAPEVLIERIDDTGHRRADGTARLPAVASPRVSLAVDEATGRRALLEEPEGMGGDCSLTLLDTAARPATRRTVTLPGGGFALTGCHQLAATGAGYSFLSDQVRALEGISLVRLDATGATAPSPAPGLVTTTSRSIYARFRHPDGAFALALRADAAREATPLAVHVYEADGTPRAEEPTALSDARPSRDFAVTAAAAGFVAVWEEVIDTLPLQFTLAVRPFDRRGQVAGARRVLTQLGFSQGGVSATFTRGDVLVTTILGSGVLRPVVLPLAADGSSRGDPLPLPTPAGAVLVGAVRIVATPAGALVVFTTDPGRQPNALVAVPITCAP